MTTPLKKCWDTMQAEKEVHRLNGNIGMFYEMTKDDDVDWAAKGNLKAHLERMFQDRVDLVDILLDGAEFYTV